MSEESILLLKELFYDRLLERTSSENKENMNSVFLKLLRGRSNTVLQLLDESAVFIEGVDSQLFNELIEQGFIRCGNEFSKYVMTAKGVWEIEHNLDKISLEKLIEDIDQYKYDINWGAELSNKEKVVVLSLIALRSFYEKTPLNRSNGERANQNIHEVILKTINFLTESIDKFKFAIPENPRESPINWMFSRLDSLPKNTRGIYKFNTKNSKSWLDIYDEDKEKLSEDKLGYLLWKVFGGNLNLEKQSKIDSFCNSVLYNHKNYVYNSEELMSFIFADISYQNAISDSLFRIAECSVIWEEMDKVKKRNKDEYVL